MIITNIFFDTMFKIFPFIIFINTWKMYIFNENNKLYIVNSYFYASCNVRVKSKQKIVDYNENKLHTIFKKLKLLDGFCAPLENK